MKEGCCRVDGIGGIRGAATRFRLDCIDLRKSGFDISKSDVIIICHRFSTNFSGISLTEAGLPTVDLRDPEASSMLATAMQEWGFSYIKGHGVPEDVIEKANEQSKRFFDLPERVKREAQADLRLALKTSQGYKGLGEERHTKCIVNPSMHIGTRYLKKSCYKFSSCRGP